MLDSEPKKHSQVIWRRAAMRIADVTKTVEALIFCLGEQVADRYSETNKHMKLTCRGGEIS